MEIENFNFLLSKDNNYILYLVTRVTKRFKSPTKVLISKQKANIDIIMKIDALEFRFDNYARYDENIYLQLYIIKTLNHYF